MPIHPSRCGFAIPEGRWHEPYWMAVFRCSNLAVQNRRATWVAAILLWSAHGVLFALPNLASSDWSRTLLGSLAQSWPWGLVTPLILWTDTGLPFKKNHLGK
jgi:hypothetical protein